MNTLPRAITAQILTDSDTYERIRQQWRKLMCSPRKHELKAAHHLLYLSLLGKDWRKGFTCPTNQRKLDNGAFSGWMLFRAIWALHMESREEELLAPFEGIVTPMMLQRLRELIPVQSAYRYRVEQFTAEGFPFEAYTVRSPVSIALSEQKSDA
jgi:hypothetical protein